MWQVQVGTYGLNPGDTVVDDERSFFSGVDALVYLHENIASDQEDLLNLAVLLIHAIEKPLPDGEMQEWCDQNVEDGFDTFDFSGNFPRFVRVSKVATKED